MRIITKRKIYTKTNSLSESFDCQGLIMDENVPHFKELIMLELSRKSSDLSHRQQLQHLLIESLNENDINKAFLINTFLNPNQSLRTSSELRENGIDSAHIYKNNLNDQTDNLESNIEMNDLEILEQSSKINQDSEAIKIDKSLRPKLRGSPLSPIRHLICSPGLEEKTEKHKIVLLYRGSCNGSCNPNKPWSKQSHFHYIVNTVNCNDHISRLVKKQGLQFFNSSVLQNPERWNHLIKFKVTYLFNL
ncbi:hypothetical protein BpHYR1_034831 [Brachionus plicatilis]|uniref:Uncharacterized protein n=1 Tax=Brachionus plicatilis TaxID=10195 RepID=A0A3M7TAP0_BRAPC|nr:hypothetical protein BpHYR1_034831 [Brachionus plicatilis]